MNVEVYLKPIRSFSDSRGVLLPFEADKEIPFAIKRVYFLTGLKIDLPRGFHAHRALVQFFVCIRGSCKLILKNGTSTSEIKVEALKNGVLIDKMIWHEMHEFSEEAVIAVFASEHYDKDDYIRDYEQFLHEISKLNG